MFSYYLVIVTDTSLNDSYKQAKPFFKFEVLANENQEIVNPVELQSTDSRYKRADGFYISS
jgi:hypothetical protein